MPGRFSAPGASQPSPLTGGDSSARRARLGFLSALPHFRCGIRENDLESDRRSFPIQRRAAGRRSPLTPQVDWHSLFIYSIYRAVVVFALQLIYISVLFRPRAYEYAAFSAVSRVAMAGSSGAVSQASAHGNCRHLKV